VHDSFQWILLILESIYLHTIHAFFSQVVLASFDEIFKKALENTGKPSQYCPWTCWWLLDVTGIVRTWFLWLTQNHNKIIVYTLLHSIDSCWTVFAEEEFYAWKFEWIQDVQLIHNQRKRLCWLITEKKSRSHPLSNSQTMLLAFLNTISGFKTWN
jgi:hypothetical protein